MWDWHTYLVDDPWWFTNEEGSAAMIYYENYIYEYSDCDYLCYDDLDGQEYSQFCMCEDELAFCEYSYNGGSRYSCMSYFCDDICTEDIDCTDELAGWVDTCAITECYNKCTMTESCTVDWTYDLDEHVGDDTCENFSEWLVDNCDIAHVIERDCTDQATAAGLEMETCVYTDVLDQCTMEYTDCYVAFDNPFTHEARG